MPTTACSKRWTRAAPNCAYELTFLFAAVLCFIYVVFIKKDRLLPKREAPKYIGAICETAGQFAYIYAIGGYIAPCDVRADHQLLLRG